MCPSLANVLTESNIYKMGNVAMIGEKKHNLVGVLQEISEEIGTEATMKLRDAFAGIELYIPHSDGYVIDKNIISILGSENIQRLIAHFKTKKLKIPKDSKTLSEIIGHGKADRLCRVYAGRFVILEPKNTNISDIIGHELAEKLMMRFGGGTIAFPTSPRFLKQEIAAAEGKTSEVAKKFGVTTRWVRYCRNEVSAKGKASCKRTKEPCE